MMNSRRAKEIFLDAIELPEAERAPFVDHACGDDPALRARVDEMLRLHVGSGELLNHPAIQLEPGWLGQTSDTTPRRGEQPGDIIGRYRLLRMLGEGGFGAVFLAEQTEPVIRQVALKVIKRGMDTDQVIARFELERQALAKMDHPGIARVLDAGATESGRPYFVMEYVDGKPITNFCGEQHHSINQRLELIEQACLAVQHAHQKGIIHRDLKPGNVLVTVVDGKPVVKVIDFGVAKAVDTESSSPAMTLEAQIVGTPQYMSPEQATTGLTQIDTRTDVYGLGTVLYELITGAPPFDPLALRRAGLERLCQIIREETPIKPSTRIENSEAVETHGIEPRTFRRQASGEVDWIVMKALEKEPARRYQSPAELAEDIRLHLCHRAVRAGPPSRVYLFRKFARRHRTAIAAAAIFALMLVGMTITSTLLAARARRAETDARAQAVRAEEELARSNAIADFTDDLLGGITPAVARGRDTALLRDLLDRSIDKAHTGLANQPRVGLAVGNIIGKALDDLGDPAAALAQLQAIYDATAAGPLRDDPERIRAGILIANIHIMQFDAERAEQVVTELLDLLRRSGREGTDLWYETQVALGGVMMRSNRLGEAESILRAVIAHCQQTGHAESNLCIRASNDLASVLSSTGRWGESVELWMRIFETERRLYGDDHPSTLMTMMDIGSALERQRKLPEAEKWMRDALAMARRIFAPGHTTLLTNLNNLGSLLMYQKRLDEAEPIFAEASETGRAKLSLSDTPLDAITLNFSRLRARQGRADDALQLSLELYRAVAAKYGPRNRRSVSLLSYVFEDFAAARQTAEGLALVRELGEFPEDTSADIRIRLEAAIGKLHFAAGDEAEARRRARASRAIVAGQPGASAPLVLRELEASLNITPATTKP